MFSRNGRAFVLVLLGRFEDAIQSLPSGEPNTYEEWVGLHIRGMAYIRQGSVDDAVAIFRRGVDRAPGPSLQNYFRTALAAALIRQRRFTDVIAELAPNIEPMPAEQRTTATVLLTHAFGAIAQTSNAQSWLDQSRTTEVPVVIDLRKALAERYSLRIVGKIPPKTRPTAQLEEFIDDQEFRLLTLLQAA